eukprot:TRINITY_DN339_c1_g3_i1.p1 TRINITY_DN339_c1_g3~~TRINITY_DN339_c1_g3_i1.p1  ORF type:complete len:218 (-),score=41.21 TRINITY_DN339_c1_g3_i1:69-722(-)
MSTKTNTSPRVLLKTRKSTTIKSWDGREHKREELMKAAKRCVRCDKKLDKLCNDEGQDTLQYTVYALHHLKKKPSKSDKPLVRAAFNSGKALRKLKKLSTDLITKQNFDWGLVMETSREILEGPEIYNINKDNKKHAEVPSNEENSEQDLVGTDGVIPEDDDNNSKQKIKVTHINGNMATVLIDNSEDVIPISWLPLFVEEFTNVAGECGEDFQTSQ